MRIAVALLLNGKVNPHFGRADQMALVDVEDGKITDWQVVDTPFAEMHKDHHHNDGETGHPHRSSHQSTIKEFLTGHDVNAVFVQHAGPGLQKVKDETDIKIITGAQGDAREAVTALLNTDTFTE